MRRNDVVAQLGGDEFVVLADGIGDRWQARVLAEKVLRAVEHASLASTLSCSVGLAFARPLLTPARLFQQADHAMYAAKQRRRGNLAFHDEAPLPDEESSWAMPESAVSVRT